MNFFDQASQPHYSALGTTFSVLPVHHEEIITITILDVLILVKFRMILQNLFLSQA